MLQSRSVLAASAGIALAFSLATPVWAHTDFGLDDASGFLSGLTHPLFGLDHVTAMIAVGLWGAVLGRPALWVLPVVFPLVMALGAVAGIAGIPLPYVEEGIAASSLILGVLVLLWARAPLWVAATIVGVFAVFHGHAHGTELPGSVHPLGYAIGFVISTGLLHLAGIALGLLIAVPMGKLVVRAGGMAIAVLGALALASAM